MITQLEIGGQSRHQSGVVFIGPISFRAQWRTTFPGYLCQPPCLVNFSRGLPPFHSINKLPRTPGGVVVRSSRHELF